MSPDPPREDSGDDENRIRRFSGDFMEGIMNDDEFFIVPDAPYELDMEEESEYSESDDETAAGATNHQSSRMSQNVVTFEIEEEEFLAQEGQGRGRYRLLIPFPNPTTEDNVNASTASNSNTTLGTNNSAIESSRSNNSRPEDIDKNATSETPLPHSSAGAGESFSDKQATSDENGAVKREIELTEEKVEKIKEVMKNITLPSSSIPNWASEIDEDSWKKKLNESISSNKLCKTDKNTQASKIS